MLITTIERESNDDDLFSKSAAILTAASEVAFHTMNTSALNAEELRRDNGISVSKGNWRSERSEHRHIQVMTIEICDIYKYVKFYHKCACAVIL